MKHEFTEEELSALKFARWAVGYTFHHEPHEREKALDSLSVLDQWITEQEKPK